MANVWMNLESETQQVWKQENVAWTRERERVISDMVQRRFFMDPYKSALDEIKPSSMIVKLKR